MIYWDHNASAPMLPEVADLIAERTREQVTSPGNAASIHRAGQLARARLSQARARVAQVLGCEAKEIVFTGSGSEADALALRGAFAARSDRARDTVVVSAIEHPALLGAALALEREGARVVRVTPAPSGEVTVDAIAAALDPRVAVCSLMWANNETGVLQPVREVARLCRERGIRFHSDAVQAVGKVPVSTRGADVDLLSLSAHKFGGPRGVGALMVRKGVDVHPLVPGHQENGRRGGTSDVIAAEALALALEKSASGLEPSALTMEQRRNAFETRLRQRIPSARVLGSDRPRVPNTSCVHFPGVDGEALLIALDLAGICVSMGAACASGSLSPSHVLTAMGLSAEEARACLRFSLGAQTPEDEVSTVVAALQNQVPKTPPTRTAT